MSETQATTSTTRERILEAAIEAFATRGFAAASTRDLGAACGVNIATLNYHFGGKDALYAACVDRVYGELSAAAAGVASAINLADLESTFRAVWKVARRHRSGVRLLLREVLDEGALREATANDHFLPLLQQHASLVGALVALPADRARAMLVTLGFLLARFVVQSESSLVDAFGVDSFAQAENHVIQSLCATAAGFLQEH
jgi:TetR/AcrR family transcriptional regulator, regulator of cefoperazone and chloramphenicol sensitivity